MVRQILLWFFRNRQTGAITVAQAPNLARVRVTSFLTQARGTRSPPDARRCRQVGLPLALRAAP